MNEGDIEKLIFSNPDKAFELLKKQGIQLPQRDIGREMVRKRYGLTPEQLSAVDFVYWASYFIERELSGAISGFLNLQLKGEQKLIVEAIVDRLHLGDKISLIAGHFSKGDTESKEFISMCWKINELRNAVAHGRFGDLSYGGYSLAEPEGQLKLLVDLSNSASGRR